MQDIDITISHLDYFRYFETFLRQAFSEPSTDIDRDLEILYKQLEKHLRSHFSNHPLGKMEIFLLILTLLPHLDPAYYDQVFTELFGEGNAPQLGGVRGQQHRGILPTGEMALFLLVGGDMEKRPSLQQQYLSNQHWFFREKILYLDLPPSGEPRLSGKLVLADEYVDLFLTGEMGKPIFSMDFPAQRIITQQEWEDLVLHPHTLQHVKNLQHWLHYGQRLLEDWGMARKFKRGYRALFYGPPGTGKTLTASLLGKHANRDVYRVDLSMVISKYIGETEKNLSKLFDKAEHKDWILFFDEADALFGKRTGVRDAHDRYANQEISYLLQRVENYDGLVILASNLRENIDKAFLRRFQALVHFPRPRPSERKKLWQKAFPPVVELDSRVDLQALAHEYEFTGADIMNIVHYCCLRTIASSSQVITQQRLLEGIQRELQKLKG